MGPIQETMALRIAASHGLKRTCTWRLELVGALVKRTTAAGLSRSRV
jgi:hypothetical protein